MRLCVYVVLASGAVFVTTAHAQASPKSATHTETRGWALDQDGMIRVHNYNGTVVVTGWANDSVHLAATIAGTMTLFGGGTRRGVKAGLESASDAGAPYAEFVLYVPMRARLSIRGASTVIDVRDFKGTLDASSLGGAIRVAGGVTELTVETMDGDVDLDASPTYVRAKTATGRVTWKGASDDVTISTVGGAVTITNAALRRARVETVTGEIRFTGSALPGGHVTFDSHVGNVTLGLSPSTDAELRVEARSGEVFGSPIPHDGATRTSVVRVKPKVPGKPVQPADVVARSFKGRVVVTQP